MAGYIPKEQLNAYRRWQVDDFDAPEPAPEALSEPEETVDAVVSEAVAEFSLPTAEDIERIHNEAHAAGYQAGFEEGHQEGHRMGLEAAQGQSQRLAALADNLVESLKTIDQAVGEQVLSLALEVAHQVVRATVHARRETLLPVIREALAALPLHHGHIALHVNPDDAALVREHLGEQFGQSGWRILDDRDVTSGGCIVKAGSSEVDATLETRWRRVLESIGADPAAWLEKP